MSMGVSGVGGSYAPQAMSGASARMSPTQRMGSLFSQIDTSGSGSINQSQFTQAFTLRIRPPDPRYGPERGVSGVEPEQFWGLVSQQNFVQGMTHRHGAVPQRRHGIIIIRSRVGPDEPIRRVRRRFRHKDALR